MCSTLATLRASANRLTPLSRHIFSGTLNIAEQARLHAAANSFLSSISGWPNDAPDQLVLAKAFLPLLQDAVPRFANVLRDVRVGRLVAAYFRGLPKDPAMARLILLAISHLLGHPFNYEGQCSGEIVMRLAPVPGSPMNTNTTPAEFSMHTDDAALPRNMRTDTINLYGLINPPGTMTSYAAAIDALAYLKRSVVEVLYEPRFRLRFPTSFGFEKELWSAPCPIVSGTDDDIELRFPSYAVRPAVDGDAVAEAAIEKLTDSLNRNAMAFALDAGCFLTFNNSRGAHRRDAIGDGDRLILRTYSARTLDFLQDVTGHPGPIFPIESFAKKISN